MKKILLIEDDIHISRLLEVELKFEGFHVDIAYDGQEGILKFKENFYNLILLDLMIPKISGEEVCESIRENSNVPIIVISAKDKTFSKVNLLDLGADDYLTKPFEMGELFARIRVALRNKNSYDKDFISAHDIKIDTETFKVFKGDKEVFLTKTELNLLQYFILNSGIAISREKLLNDVWGYDYDGVDKVVDVYIKSLRQKVDKEKSIIQTIRGIGYVFKKES